MDKQMHRDGFVSELSLDVDQEEGVRSGVTLFYRQGLPEMTAGSVDDVLITKELARRESRPPDYAAENRAINELAREIANSPQTLLQRLVNLALELCGAGSAGVSILELEEAGSFFRWHAIAGEWAPHAWGTLPRFASPCGTVLDRNCPLLFEHPERFFTAARGVEPPIHEVLLVPFHVRGETVGTVWVLSHSPELLFQAEDARLLMSLSSFASVGYSFLNRKQTLRDSRKARIATLNLMEDAVIAREAAERVSAALRESEAKLARELECTRALQRIGSILIQEKDAGFLHEQILEAAMSLLHADMGSLQTFDLKWQKLHTLASKGFHSDSAPRLETLPFIFAEDGSLQEVERIVIPDVAKSNLLEKCGGLENPAVHGIVSMQSTPLRSRDGRIVGIITTFWRHAHEPCERELRFLDMLARQAADILEHIRAENVLRQNEAQFRRAIEEAPIPVIMHAEDGEVLQISRTWTELTGCLPEDLLSIDAWLNNACGSGADKMRERMRHLFATGKSLCDLEMEVLTRSGERRIWMFNASSPGTLPDGRRFIVTMAADITELRKSEASLRESEERIRIAVEAAEMATWEWDLAADEVIWNDLHFHLFGMEPGRNPRKFAEFLEHVNPADRDWMAEHLRNCIATRSTFRAEFRAIREDGSDRWMSGYGKITGESEGKPTRMSGVTFDITERKLSEKALRESEERFRLLLESAREYAIFTTDLDLRVKSWNPGAERILGYKEDEILGQSGAIIFTPEDRAAEQPKIEKKEALEKGRAIDERWHQRKDGSRFWSSGFLMPMRDNADNSIGLVKILRDDSERQRAKQELESSHQQLWKVLQDNQRAREEAENANKAKDRFLAVLSHELRTPLTPVLMATQLLLRRRDVDPELADVFQMIHRNVQLESHFIDDLLDLTRLKQGKLEILRCPLDMQTVLKSAIEISLSDIKTKSQKLTTCFDATQCSVMGDAKRLQQVFWNLLKNSSKFTPKGGKVSVRSWNEPGSILVEVRDTGIGFEQDAFERIFDDFVQLDSSIARDYCGLGLGLAITRKMAPFPLPSLLAEIAPHLLRQRDPLAATGEFLSAAESAASICWRCAFVRFSPAGGIASFMRSSVWRLLI